MAYTLPGWSDNPATSSPLDAANLTLVNDAIEDLDSRSTTLADGLSSVTDNVLTLGLATATGDLIVAESASVVGSLNVGSDGQVLTADHTQTLGVKWATPTPGGVTSVTAANSTITITGTSTVTVAVGTIAESQVSGLSTDLAARVSKSTLTTKGDLYVATASATPARLAVGSNTQVLTADSAQTAGMKWATPAPAGVVSIVEADSSVIVDATDPANPTIAVDQANLTLAESQITGLTSDLSAKATDTAVVHNTGAETVAGIKTFSSSPVVPTPGSAGNPVRNDDSRLSDARTPTAHHTTHSTGGTDAIAPGDIGAEATTHKGAASGYASLDGSTLVPIAQIPTGSSSSTVAIGNDSRLSDARTPTAHHTTHSTGGTDAIAPGDIGALAVSTVTTKGDLLAATASATIARVGVGSNGQGLLADSTQTPGIKWGTVVTSVAAADGTISVAGTGAAPTFAVGAIAESQVTNLTTDLSGKVATSRQVIAGSGLSGGGALTSDVTLTAARVTSPANTVTYSSSITIDPTLGNNQNITATGALTLAVSTTGAIDGQMLMVSVLASGGARVVTLSGINIPAGLSSTLSVTSTKVGLFGFRYVGLLGTPAWVLMSEIQTT